MATTAIQPGGVWRHICDLADGLAVAGVPVRLDLPAAATALRADARRRGLLVDGEPFRREVFHAHLGDTYDRPLTARLIWLRSRGRRIVVTEHLPRTDASDPRLADRSPRPGAIAAKSAFKRLQYGLSDRVIAVSRGSADFLAERYRVGPEKVRVIHNGIECPSGVDRPPSTPGPPRDTAAHFVAAGSVIAQKGYDLLLAAAQMARADWQVDVWGEGRHRAELAASAARITRPDGRPRIRFQGWTDDVPGRVMAADALVMPSRWESFGYSALEAMAAGRPVVATGVDGLAEVVEHEVTGLLVRPECGELAEALDRLAKNPALRARLGANAYRRARTRFPRSAMVEATVGVYEECLAGRVRGGCP